MYVLALSDYKQHAAAAGYKPAPQLGRSPTRFVILVSFLKLFRYLCPYN